MHITEKFDVTGMNCSACSSHIERDVAALDGVSGVTVHLLTNSMTVEYDNTIQSADSIIAAVEKAGYGAKKKTMKEEIQQHNG